MRKNLAPINGELTCIGPFMDIVQANLEKYDRMMMSGTTTLIPIHEYNPFKDLTLEYKYNNLLSSFLNTCSFKELTLNY
jgi:hypothetical protein